MCTETGKLKLCYPENYFFVSCYQDHLHTCSKSFLLCLHYTTEMWGQEKGISSSSRFIQQKLPQNGWHRIARIDQLIILFTNQAPFYQPNRWGKCTWFFSLHSLLLSKLGHLVLNRNLFSIPLSRKEFSGVYWLFSMLILDIYKEDSSYAFFCGIN